MKLRIRHAYRGWLRGFYHSEPLWGEDEDQALVITHEGCAEAFALMYDSEVVRG